MRAAGILLYRTDPFEVFLGHPGSPFYKNKQRGVWTVPKGRIEDSDPSDERAALREFAEETGFEPKGPLVALGEVRYKSGKRLVVFACEHRGPDFPIESNTFTHTFPSGSKARYPELDTGRFVPILEARDLIHPVQRPLLDELEARR